MNFRLPKLQPKETIPSTYKGAQARTRAEQARTAKVLLPAKGRLGRIPLSLNKKIQLAAIMCSLKRVTAQVSDKSTDSKGRSLHAVAWFLSWDRVRKSERRFQRTYFVIFLT